MKCFELNLNDKVVRLRLTSANICQIEKEKKKSIVEIMQDISQSNIIDMLMYMCRFDTKDFNTKQANELYDELIDEGYSMQDIVFDIIYETLVISGVMLKKELEQLRTVVGIQTEKVQEKIEDLQK